MYDFVRGSIWAPTDGIPDLSYCACLMHHAAEKLEHSVSEFQYELSMNSQLYQKSFAMLRDLLESLGYDPRRINL